jgi:regulator of protease activity HflC (stomatin/prohibitin superfamily)
MRMRRTIAILVLVGAAALVASTQYVHRGYVGVTGNGGHVRVTGRGLHLKAPWHRTTFYPIETRCTSVRASRTGSLGTAEFDITLHLRVERDSAAALHTRYGGRYVEVLVVPLAADFLEEHAGADSVSFGPRATSLAKEMQGLLHAELSHLGINIAGVEIGSYRLAADPDRP